MSTVSATMEDPIQLSFESSEAATQRPQDLPIQYNAFSWRSPLANTQDVTSTTPIRQPQETTPDISLKTKYQQGVSAEEAAASREFAATWFLDPLPVCPTTRSLLPASLTSLSKNEGESKLRRGRDGKIRIVYPDDSDDDEIRPAHGKSMRVKQPETPQQLETCTSDFIELIKVQQKGLRGFTTGSSNSKVKVGDSGQYRVGSECADLKTVLGRGTSVVLLVRDNVTGQEHATKTVLVAEFKEHGLRCWVSVNGSDYFPCLYLVYAENGEVVFHMERIEGVTLDHLLNECLDKDFRIRNPIAMKYFSCWVLHGVLRAVDKLNAQLYNHNDLHAANLMIQREPIKLRVLDLELAQPLDELNKKMSRKCDILNTVRLFCAVSLRTSIGDPKETEKQLQQFSQHEGPLYKLFSESLFLDDETKSFVYDLLSQLHGYLQEESAHTLQGITRCIEQHLFPEDRFPGLLSSDCREKMAEMFSEVFAEFLIPGIQDLHETAPAATPDTAEEPSISDEQLLQLGLNKPSEPDYDQ